jgi:hypothetical protein
LSIGKKIILTRKNFPSPGWVAEHPLPADFTLAPQNNLVYAVGVTVIGLAPAAIIAVRLFSR